MRVGKGKVWVFVFIGYFGVKSIKVLNEFYIMV